MANTDNKVKEMLKVIETKREELGTKPKAVWKSNGLLKFGDNRVNINTVNSLSQCVDLAANILTETLAYDKAVELLGVENNNSERLVELNDYLSDLQLRVKILRWDEDKKKLGVLEKKLKDLRSEQAKTEDALSDISASLGL